MSHSYTNSYTKTFTVTHARHIASKVATDLKRMQRFYRSPSDRRIAQFEEELVAMLKAGYLREVTYGFRRNGRWVEPMLRYRSTELTVGNDDDPGRVRPGAATSGATFYSYMTYSSKWDALTEAQKRSFKATLPFQRGGAPEPDVDGYLSEDKTYSAGGRGVTRSTLRAWR